LRDERRKKNELLEKSPLFYPKYDGIEEDYLSIMLMVMM